tara:strand:- start:507 stop:839 length:333 start_codon:yes stop_codon:yes gene_type:complete
MIKSIGDMRLAIVGLGYVGLPLAVAFGEKMSVVGFDINHKRIDRLQEGQDDTLEVSQSELSIAEGLVFSSDAKSLPKANVYIVTVPTPIDRFNRPDLTPLIKSSETIAKF